MNNSSIQKIYTSAYSDELYLQRNTQERLKEYGSGNFTFLDDSRTISLSLELNNNSAELIIKNKDRGQHDGDNAEIFYNSYRSIPIDLAFDKNFWIYLTHNNFKSYALNRWVKVDEPKEGTIKERFFIQGYSNDRGLERNAIARLWWAAHLTTNFNNNPELDYFFDKIDDPYFYTKVLCSNQNLWVQVLGHSFGRGKKILLSALKHAFDNRKKIEGKQKEYALFISNRIGLFEHNQSLHHNSPEEISQILKNIASF